jgi:hypothetical protein
MIDAEYRLLTTSVVSVPSGFRASFQQCMYSMFPPAMTVTLFLSALAKESLAPSHHVLSYPILPYQISLLLWVKRREEAYPLHFEQDEHRFG